jgi:chromosome segregation ATPase
VLDNPWLFVVLYLGLILAFFTAVTVIFWWWLKRRRRAFDEELADQVTRVPDPEIQLKNLENQIEKLIVMHKELNERLKWIESQLGALLAQGGRQSQKATLEEQVYRAFDRGQPVTELARQFGRNKGEIELMLNLRRMRKEGGGG